MRKLVARSTDEVAPDQRVRYWRDAVHEAVVETDLLPSIRADFRGEIELCPLANIVPIRPGDHRKESVAIDSRSHAAPRTPTT